MKNLRLPLRLLLLVTLFWTAQLWSKTIHRSQRAQPIKLYAGNAILKGFRYLNAKLKPNQGPRVLLVHGLNSNTHEFEGLLPFLLEQGFDCYAFNFRGHGNGSERSTVIEYEDGDYGFEPMVNEDFPEMLNFVRGAKREGVIVIGHSMGGMISRAALISKTVDVKDIQSLVLVGSPSHFENQKLIIEYFPLSSRMASWMLNSGRGDESVDLLGFVKTVEDLGSYFPGYVIAKKMLSPLQDYLFGGISLFENFGPEDTWIHNAVTRGIPKDIFRSFERFKSANGYPWKDKPIEVPALHILGRQDQLVLWRDVVESAAIQSKDAGYGLMVIDNVSHLDLVATKTIQTYWPTLLEFMTAPEQVASNCEILLTSRMGQIVAH